jgi:hypothetical protein
MKDLVRIIYFSSKFREWMEVEISFNVRLSNFYPREVKPKVGASYEPLDMLDRN